MLRSLIKRFLGIDELENRIANYEREKADLENQVIGAEQDRQHVHKEVAESTSTSDIVDAIYDSGDLGAKVISMSFGSYWNSNSLKNAVNWAHNTKGIILCAAAGNDGTSSKHYPAAYSNVRGVGAVNSAGNRKGWLNRCRLYHL